MSNSNGFNIDAKGTLTKYTGKGGDVVIPDGVTSIGSYAFEDCVGMTSITIPASVTGIGLWAFKNCTSLISIHIPDSVISIGDSAFSGCSNLTSIVIPDSVTSIGDSAFRGCSSLTCIPIPEGVTNIGSSTFSECSSLTSIIIPESVTRIGNDAFSGCTSLTSVNIPAGVTRISANTFKNCANLTSLTIPNSVTYIGERAFSGCTSLTSVAIPRKLTGINCSAFSECRSLGNAQGQYVVNGILFSTREKSSDNPWTSMPKGVSAIANLTIGYRDSFCMPAGVTKIGEGNQSSKVSYAEDFFHTDKELSGEGFYQLLKENWASKLTAEDWAYLYLFQSGKTLEEILSANSREENATVEGMLTALDRFGKKKHFVRAAKYMLKNMSAVSTENVRKLYNLCKAQKANSAAELLSAYVTSEDSGEGAYAEWNEVYKGPLLDKSIKEKKGVNSLFAKVRLAGKEELAPPFIVKCAIVPYLDQYAGRPKQIGGYRKDYIAVELIALADKAAELLNPADLQVLVEKEYAKGGSPWLLPYCRYASGAQVTALLSKMCSWEDWNTYSASGRSDIITARGALVLSETREAMVYLDKCKILGTYASMRGIDTDVLRDTRMMDFGLDANGRKSFDLGNTTIEASIGQDLSISLWDATAGKAVKSLPKKGADPEKHAVASAELSDLKKNLKKVVKSRNDLLFERFLNGETQPAHSWIESYAKNPVLHRVAELIVWSQRKATFILTANGAVDCNGNGYVIQKSVPIGVAHPMDMEKGDVVAWQKYFAAHGLKQPFAQVWEPVIDPATIRKDRYKGIMIPFYRFAKQEKHGITVRDEDFHNIIDISFKDCDATVDRVDRHKRHYIDYKEDFEVTYFGFRKYTYRVNHIVGLLDKWTMYDQILKDDASIVEKLPEFTLAQIEEFLKLATDNNCTNVTAALLEFKHDNFEDFDPMAEFTLDW